MPAAHVRVVLLTAGLGGSILSCEVCNMRKPNSMAMFASRAVALSAALLLPVMVRAQNCALCYTQAAGSGQRFIQALRSGILILMLPPMAISLGLAYMAYRKRNQFNED
jgi:hypothetical protein